ncbi:MAG: Rieske 2Fe-2S domain-containing protein [Polyangiaceae bacterium]|nr:Rieske 2Fe-2S domain-containing protein [Polyangiaceae bacterium]
MPSPHEDAILLETYLGARRDGVLTKQPPRVPAVPGELLPALDDDAKRRARAVALTANDRYVQSFLEEHSICPFSRGGRLQGVTARHVHFAHSPDAGPVLELMAEAATQPQKAVIQVIFPMLEVHHAEFRDFCHDVTSAGNARLPGGETYAVAPLHPGLPYTERDAYTIIPLFRRAPDPTIQWVRLDAIEAIYAGRSSKDIYVPPSEIWEYLSRPKQQPLFDKIAESNLKMARRLGVASVEQTLRSIAAEARAAYQRALLGEAPVAEGPQASEAAAPARRFLHRSALPPLRVEGDAVALAPLRELPLRSPTRFLAEGVELVAIRTKEEVHVFYGRCPHRAAPLDAAIVEAEHMVCPYHGWDFRLADGRSDGVPGEGVHRFRARVEGGLVWLELAELRRVKRDTREVFTEDDVVLLRRRERMRPLTERARSALTPRVSSSPRPAALVLVLAALAAGCSKKAPECQAMVGVINPTSDAMMRAGAKKPGDAAEHAAEMRKVATVTKNAADAMGKLTITVPELKKVQTEYGALYSKASADAGSLADAIDAIATADAEMQKVGAALKGAIDAWGAACSSEQGKAEAPGCKAFAEAMQSLPNDPTDQANVDKALALMDKAPWKGDELRATAKRVRDAYASSTKQIGAMHALGAKAEAAEKAMKSLDDKEQALIDGFNKFCKE